MCIDWSHIILCLCLNFSDILYTLSTLQSTATLSAPESGFIDSFSLALCISFTSFFEGLFCERNVPTVEIHCWRSGDFICPLTRLMYTTFMTTTTIQVVAVNDLYQTVSKILLRQRSWEIMSRAAVKLNQAEVSYVRLQSSDGETFEVSLKVAKLSRTLETMLRGQW